MLKRCSLLGIHFYRFALWCTVYDYQLPFVGVNATTPPPPGFCFHLHWCLSPQPPQHCEKKKIIENLNFNGYLLMGWSESHYSVDFHSPAHQQTFIEISIFAYFFLSVYGLSSRPPGPRSLQRATLYPLLQPPPRPLHALCSPSCHRAPLAGYYSLMPTCLVERMIENVGKFF